MSKNFSYHVIFRVNNGRDTTCILKNYPYIGGLDFEYTGVAHLHKGDKYDKKKGERIALLKARRKWHRAMGMLLIRKIDELDAQSNEAWRMIDKYWVRYNADNAEIQKLVKEK